MVIGEFSTLDDGTELDSNAVLPEDNVASKEEDKGTDVGDKDDGCS